VKFQNSEEKINTVPPDSYTTDSYVKFFEIVLGDYGKNNFRFVEPWLGPEIFNSSTKIFEQNLVRNQLGLVSKHGKIAIVLLPVPISVGFF